MKYSPASIVRAEKAIVSSPFTLKLLSDLSNQGVSLKAIAAEEGLKNGYLTKFANLITVENSLLWLIDVGVLRREVDGQGITDSFRLTPLGYEILAKWQPQKPIATWSDRFENLFNQSMRFFSGIFSLI
ncbi:hypothetical protein Syn7502_00636 [Synechococcus sp. PCC 7502]|uniref:Npun_F0494 family protein n=1 Tax=Synechococcus sp. PCC 7502 TaxID=1173263 RepID=UPI00029FE57E|nr:Npun_F0494 family protein [Synechococcus sp. PCC 7502]AFY72785.1 hypothetical protein Syn7502_00636 [Synechococcus sp. PCC 7502]